MNTLPTTSKSIHNNDFDDEDIFDDSTFLANFENTSFKKQPNSHINNSANTSGLNVSALCCDEEISGYDKLTGKTWIYPTNYPVRDYQFNIIKAAILKNTLVSLPTGLGKTFIAAVIMYNFYRWYPLGKIVFTAPTRPLIAQQIEACYNIIAIPPSDTIEMTGHMQASTRKTHWINKRVFFATPQVIYNDIKSGICPGDKIRCLVIDEAHRARKNYAYCQIVSCLDDMGHKIYRLLALSATPGSRVEDVVSVINCLHIAHLELRTEDCIDVAPYSHSRNINTVIVQLGPELTQLRHDFVEIMDGYARRLKQLNILPQNLGNLSKGRIVMLYKEFQAKDRSLRHPQHNYIMKDFTNLISLFHGLELLLKHGSRVFLNFFDEHPEKTWIQADYKLSELLERLREDLGINPLSLNTSVLPDGTVPEIPKDIRFGHPKFDKLKEIMMEHFTAAKRKGQDTRAIVFCEYRESVNLVHCLLLQCRPLIIPQTFVGQGASGKDGKTVVSQKQQLRVMRAFRGGACNTLVATCVAEEGLDVGAVDLILCFDISTRSPVRLVQRCGRTGRERSGQVHILVTEGREHQTLMECMRQRDGLNKKILQSKEVEHSLYKCNPRMIPHDFMPKCERMHITVAKKNDTKAKSSTVNTDKKGQKDLRTMLLERGVTSAAKTTKEVTESNYLKETEFNELFPQGYVETNYLTPAKEYLAMNKDSLKKINDEQGHLKLYTWIDWQRTSQNTISVGHSTDAEILSELLRYSDAKRFEMESTQKQCLNTQNLLSQNIVPASPAKSTNTLFASPIKTIPNVCLSPNKSKVTKKKQKVQTKSPTKNNGDIRALFSTATKSTKNYTKLITDLGITNDGSVSTSMVNLLVELNMDNNNFSNCYICKSLYDCSLMKNMKENQADFPMHLQFLKSPVLPDISLIQDFDVNVILKCGSKREVLLNDTCLLENKQEISLLNKTCTGNFDLELDFDLTNETNSLENIPEPSLDNVKTPISVNIGGVDELFIENNPLEVINDSKNNVNKEEMAQDTLKFFGLDSIEDIFADYEDSSEFISDNKLKSIENNNNDDVQNNTKDKNVAKTPTRGIPMQSLSPSILSGNINPVSSNTSPILCSQSRTLQLSTKKSHPHYSTPSKKSKKRLTLEQINDANDIVELKDKMKATFMKNGQLDTSNKSMLTITQLVDMINKTEDSFETGKEKKESASKHNIDVRSISPILLTQADKKKNSVAEPSKASTSQVSSKKNESLIILESDSDSNDTIIYDYKNEIMESGSSNISKSPSPTRTKLDKDSMCTFSSNVYYKNQISSPGSKRKLEMVDVNDLPNSPYFNKKQKLENRDSKQLSMQEKILVALKSDKLNMFNNDRTTLHFTVSQQNTSQKENYNPHFLNNTSNTENVTTKDNKLQMLQMYRRDNKIQTNVRNKTGTLFKNNFQERETSHKRRIQFDDSDDDFIIEDNSVFRSPRANNSNIKVSSTTNHKVRKKRKKGNSFLDLEAEQSDDSNSESGDELSDDSVGSIAEFICDENITHHEDMHAHYVKSVRSPLKGGFKIPELPKRFNKADILSQYVEEDEYEMDSFCVDSHVGLTQVNEVSELELAEIILEQKKKSRRMGKSRAMTQNGDDSPVIKRRNKNAKRQIHSDSDDSS